jgi:signal transduction histidine kinase
LLTLVNVICVAITYCFQLTGQKKYSSFWKNLPLYTNEFRLLADFLIKTLPIVACFTEIALFLCINHELLQQLLATITKKTLKTRVIPWNFSPLLEIAVTFLLHYKVSTLATARFHVFYTTLLRKRALDVNSDDKY